MRTAALVRGIPARWASRASLDAVATQGVGNASLNAATLVLNFGLTLLLSRLLGTHGFGEYSFAIAFSTLLAVPAMLGLTPLLIREVASYRVQSRWPEIRGLLRRANEVVVVSSLLLAAAGAGVCWLLGWPDGRFFHPALLALALVPLVGITSVRQGAMQGFGRIVVGRSPEAGVSPALTILFCGSLALAAGARFSASWAVAANVAATALAAIFGMELLRRTIPHGVRESRAAFDTARWSRAAVPFVLFSVVQTVNTQIPTVLLGALNGPHAAGIYAVVTRISNLLPFLLVAAIPALMPAIVELHARNDRPELQRVTTRAARSIFFASLPLALVAILFAEPVLRIFGGGFGSGETALRILALGQLINVGTGFAGTVLLMVGEAGWVTIGATIGAVTTVVLGTTLIPGLGAEGAAVASAASTAVSNVLLAAVLWRRWRIYSPAVSLPRLDVSAAA